MKIKDIDTILNQEQFSKNDLVYLLAANKEETEKLFAKAAEIKTKYVGNIVYFRGLIEFSNVCRKDCLYCGIRCGNKKVSRYTLTDDEILEAVEYSWKNNFGSIVLQSGERNDSRFVERVELLLKKIHAHTNYEMGITLSLGEQSEETYRRWLAAGAHRYLLRIESTNRELYQKIHPADNHHEFDTRKEGILLLQKTGFQVGTGVMIGLPFQTLEDLAGDLLFMKEMDIDMCGMGPYIEHVDTPMYQYVDMLMPLKQRFELALKMIATLRILMKDVNIASSTALQAIDPYGRELGLKVGANIIMPNTTPVTYHQAYSLYNNKPTVNEETDEYIADLEQHIHAAGDVIGYGVHGDSVHFGNRINKNK